MASLSKNGSKSEKGHAKNVANFEQLTAYAASIGSVYNPAKDSLKLASLQALLTSANSAITAVNEAFTINSNSIAERETAFKPLTKLITRASKAFEISEATDEVKQNIKSVVKKLKGQRVSAKLTEEEKAALAANGESTKQVSASQMGFDNRIENLDKFIKLLASSSQYAPNEEELQTASLTAMYNDLRTKNSAAMNAETILKNARIARNEIIYKEKTGLVDIAQEVKKYLISVDGTDGPKYKAVSKLDFSKLRQR